MEHKKTDLNLKAFSPAEKKNFEAFCRVRNDMKAVMEMRQREANEGRPMSPDEVTFATGVERALVELILYFSEKPALRKAIGICEVDLRRLESRGKVSPLVWQRFYDYAQYHLNGNADHQDH